MENSINSNIKTSLIAVFPLLFLANLSFGFVETKRFDANPPPRAKYLVNSRPSVLQYADPVVIADRRVLLSLASPTTQTPAPSLDQNSTQTSSIPLIAYEDDKMPSLNGSGNSAPNVDNISNSEPILPPPDPFNDNATGGNLNSTDDLLDLFEQTSRNRSVSSGYNVIPFIPPFTSAPDNLRVETRASYQKIRK